MEKQEANYTLRPRRSVAKGKYREILSVGSLSQDDSVSEGRVEIGNNTLAESRTEILNKGCKIFILPSVISDGSDILTDNTIEIEISEGVSVSELDDLGTIEEEEEHGKLVSKQENPLQHIDEILKQNDELIESIPEGPSFKKRGKTFKEESNVEKRRMFKICY